MTTSIQRSALVLHSAAQMYDLVNDVESYPAYIDDCCGAEILEQDNRTMVARLDLCKKGVSYSFITRNTLEPNKAINLQLHSGPFKRLSGAWLFKVLSPQACKVSFHLEFDVNNSLVGVAATSLFASMANNMVAVLCERADYIYGKSTL